MSKNNTNDFLRISLKAGAAVLTGVLVVLLISLFNDMGEGLKWYSSTDYKDFWGKKPYNY